MPDRYLIRLFDQPLAEEDREEFLREMHSANYWAGQRARGWYVLQVMPALQPRHNV